MFRTVGDEVQFVDSVRESPVVDLPNVTGRDVVWRDSFGRLLTLPSWIETVGEAKGLGTVIMLPGAEDSWGPVRPDAKATAASDREATRADLSESEVRRLGVIEIAIMVNRTEGPAEEFT